jgi:hypothetical protein
MRRHPKHSRQGSAVPGPFAEPAACPDSLLAAAPEAGYVLVPVRTMDTAPRGTSIPWPPEIDFDLYLFVFLRSLSWRVQS